MITDSESQCRELMAMISAPSTREIGYQIFFKKYYPVVCRYLQKQSRHLEPADVEEIAQEFFLKIFRIADRIDLFTKSCEGWWRTICRNMFISWLRKHEKHTDNKVVEMTDALGSTPKTVSEKLYTHILLTKVFDDELVVCECYELIINALRQTHPKRWELLMLFTERGLDRAEVAALLDKSPEAVSNMLHETIKQLKILKEKRCE